jgi:hypothetical protein
MGFEVFCVENLDCVIIFAVGGCYEIIDLIENRLQHCASCMDLQKLCCLLIKPGFTPVQNVYKLELYFYVHYFNR